MQKIYQKEKNKFARLVVISKPCKVDRGRIIFLRKKNDRNMNQKESSMLRDRELVSVLRSK